MNCSACGKEIPAEGACPSCGALPAAAPQQAPVQTPTLPSLYLLKCPHCGAGELLPLGAKGATGKSFATTFAFGAIGNIVAGANAEADWTTQPLQYKCLGCKKKFEAGPLVARQDELLSAPCNIHFERLGSFAGMAVPQLVYLNGLKMGPVGNKKAIDFPTYLKYNTLFVTDHHGVAFKAMYKFEATPGGNIHVRFRRKFV